MDDSPLLPSETLPQPELQEGSKELRAREKRIMIGLIIGGVVVLILLILFSIYLFNPANAKQVAQIRNVFIIFLGLQSILVGFVLVIVMIQLARLLNLLENEIKPILDSTNDTVNNLRGTTVFLSENVVEPIIKLNENIASFLQVLAIVGLFRRKPR